MDLNFREINVVQIIVADKKYNMEHKLGQFLDESDYDVLIETDTDAYMPPDCDISTQANCADTRDCSSCDKGSNEKRIAFKFRKNFFTKEEQEQAYNGLRNAATETQNRGLASGPREASLGNRQWVTEYEYDILDHFLKQKPNLFGEDPIDVIKNKYVSTKPEISNRNNVWALNAVKNLKFIFEDWVQETRKLSLDEQKKAAEWVASKLITDTTYANSVNSGIAGWFDRYPRIPYGRATTYTERQFDKFAMAFPFLQSLNRGFKELLPWRWSNQKAAADKIDSRFLVPETVFTTVTVNKTFRTAAHYDAGDLQSGLSNLLVLSNDGNFTGGYLIFPEYRMAVNVRPGDLLLVNNHEIMHGNTPIVLGSEISERVSLVVYFREKMLELGSKEYEDCRKAFVDFRRLDKDHPEQRPLWNGISAGMWTSSEWHTYCESKLGLNVLQKYHPETIEQASLAEFF